MGEWTGTSGMKAQDNGAVGRSSREHRGSPRRGGGRSRAWTPKGGEGRVAQWTRRTMVGKVWQVCVDGDLITAAGTEGWRFVMRLQGIRSVMVAALALFLGIAASAWSQLADPMAEDYTAHVIPFYKIDANWSAFLVVADTSFQDLDDNGSPSYLTFYNAACNLVSDAIVEL